MDLAMGDRHLADYRQSLLASVSGKVLEIGFGTGLNLAHYPASVREIDTVDVNPGMSAIAAPRIAQSGITIHNHVLSGEALPMADASFDAVISTWTLCSIPNVAQAIAEVHRVLKPGGRFFFIEHGLSDDPKVQTWQHRLTPIQKVLGDGCHLDRDMRQLIGAKFSQMALETFPDNQLPKPIGYFYKGIATK
jgi:ubiquinone/menaquinone biosynthesis C-methylase UbiE